MSNETRNLAKIRILEREFADLAVHTVSLVGFRLEYAGDSSNKVRLIPPENVATIALGNRYYCNEATHIPNTPENRARFENSRLLRSRPASQNSYRGMPNDEEPRATALEVLESDQLLEPPTPIEFIPLSTGCLYVYGDSNDLRKFASISEAAGTLTNLPKTFRNWYEFLFDYGIRMGEFQWHNLGELKFTNALNLPRLSTEAIASLYDLNPHQVNGDKADQRRGVGNIGPLGSAMDLEINALGPKQPLKNVPEVPAWKRLKLQQSSDGSDHTAELDGKRFRIRGNAAFKMLLTLQEKKGERVKALLLQKILRQKPDKVLKLLDDPLQRIVDAPGKGRIGYAML